MTVLVQWESALGWAMSPRFSPSGNALATCPLLEAPGRNMQTIEFRFADNRLPVTVESDSMIHPLDWASDTEFVYRVVGQPLGVLPHSALWAFSLETGRATQVLLESDHGVHASSVTQTGRPGHLSVLSKPNGKPGVFDFDVTNGKVTRVAAFDTALQNLEVYPLFGHAWSEARQEVALIAWPHGDYLEAGIEPTTENSQWTPLLDAPAIQDCVSLRPDGTRVTQRELTQEAKRCKPPRLFVLSSTGECREVPGTYNAHDSHWSPDGSLISYQDRVLYGDSGICLLRRDDFSRLRLGTSPVSARTILHPSGILLAEMEDKSLPVNEKLPPQARSTRHRWRAFRLQSGEVSPA